MECNPLTGGNMISLLPTGPALENPFSDRHYLGNLLTYLKHERRSRGLSVEALAAKAGLKECVIDQAEQQARIPNSRELRKWSAAFGMRCEDTWSAVLSHRPVP